MPSKINTSDLTIITRELITLGGNQYDSKHTQIIPNIKEVTKRIITVPTASILSTDINEGIEVLKMTPNLLTGPYKEADVRYIRVTNLDDTNFITLQLHNDQGNVTAKKLDFGGTYFYNCDNGSGSIDTMQASSNTLIDTDATVNYQIDDATVTCNANEFIRVGSVLSGSSHFPSGSFIASINNSGTNDLGEVTSFELNTPATLTGTNIPTVFQIGLQDLDAIYAVADTENVDIEIFVASV
tara:strand:+ start:2128 stop:2850 length:723 start_codon:yes stop_codon:yes gene_type:complete